MHLPPCSRFSSQGLLTSLIFLSAVVGGKTSVAQNDSSRDIANGGSVFGTLFFEVTPSSDSFGDVLIGASAVLNFTLTNSATRNVSPIPAFSELAAPFSVDTGTCRSLPGGMGRGQSCQFSVRFAPTARSLASEVLTITQLAAVGPKSASKPSPIIALSLSGRGLMPATLTSSAASHDFGKTAIGASSSVELSFTNVGDVSATDVQLSGLADPFSVSSCGSEIAPQARCTISMAFTPNQRGPISPQILSVRYHSGLTYRTSEVAVTGAGVKPALLSFSMGNLNPNVSYPLGLINFGSRKRTTSVSQVITVTNSGEAAASLVGPGSPGLADPFFYSGGAYPGDAYYGACGSSLAPSASCSLVIRFSPSKTGTYSGALALSYHDGVKLTKVQVSLAGKGTPAAILSIPPVDFGDSEVGGARSLSSLR